MKVGTAAEAWPQGQTIGDAQAMLRRLGVERGPKSGVDREILGEIEQHCLHCRATFACGALLASDGRLAAPPAFCPNAARFRCLTIETEHHDGRSSTQAPLRQALSGCRSLP